MPGRQKDSSNPAVVVWASRLLLLAAAVNAVLFIFWHPLDWQQPETIRLRFYGLQNGLIEGPLTSRITGVDFLKPFANRAQGGGYESRYPTVLLDGLLAKLHQPLYRVLGPFLKEPVNILILALTGLAIFAAVKAFFDSVSAACLGTAFWLISSQVLLDLCYPVRVNMVLTALTTAFILWRLALLPRLKPSWSQLIPMVLAFLLGFHSHESIFCLLPACFLIVAARRRRYKGWESKLAVGALAGVVLAFLNMFVLIPRLVEAVTGAPPLWAWLEESLAGSVLNRAVLGERVSNFLFVGLEHLARQEGGMSALLPLPAQVLGAASSVGLLLMAGRRGWKAAWPFCLGAFFFFALTAFFLFPAVPASVETEAYYYAPIVVVLSVAGAGLFSGFARPGVPLRGFLPLLLLAVTGILNTLNADAVMKAFPYWFGFRGPAQEYVRDVVNLEERIEENGVRSPVYLSYPRPRRFDISTKWDVMLRIWNVDPPLVFAMMVPTLHLGSFEAGEFLGDPRGFSRFSAVPEGRYESAALTLADLPRRGWYDLAGVRADSLNPVAEAGWFDPGTGKRVSALPEPGLLGTVPRARLAPGLWELALPPREEGSVCLFALRADLQASGDDEVYYREQPLPEKGFRLAAFSGDSEFRLGPQYGWSFRIYEFQLAPAAPARLEVETEGDCEVLGPVFLPVSGGYFRAWGRPTR